jgi:ligand-binding SRPBCC domain-containing protein
LNNRVSFQQELDVPVERARAFFSDVRNLRKISPAFPKMEIDFEDPRITEGAEFRIQLSFGIGSYTWVSRIETVRPDGSFTDTSRGALFPHWRHTHRFLPSGEGTIVVDEIEYRSAWWIAPFAGGLLRILFTTRRKLLRRAIR